MPKRSAPNAVLLIDEGRTKITARCPDSLCSEEFSALEAYTDHRFDVHNVLSDDAVREWDQAVRIAKALAAGPDPTTASATPAKKEKTMATPMTERTCGHCAKKGHRRDHCPSRAEPAAARCSGCRRADGTTHAPKCPRGPGRVAISKTASPRRSGARKAQKPVVEVSVPGSARILPGIREARATCEAWATAWAGAAKSLSDLEDMASGQIVVKLPASA